MEGNFPLHCPLREFGPQSCTLALPRLTAQDIFLYLLPEQDTVLVSLLPVGIQGLFTVQVCWTLGLSQCDQVFELWNNTQARKEDLGPWVRNLLIPRPVLWTLDMVTRPSMWPALKEASEPLPGERPLS